MQAKISCPDRKPEVLTAIASASSSENGLKTMKSVMTGFEGCLRARSHADWRTATVRVLVRQTYASSARSVIAVEGHTWLRKFV